MPSATQIGMSPRPGGGRNRRDHSTFPRPASASSTRFARKLRTQAASPMAATANCSPSPKLMK